MAGTIGKDANNSPVEVSGKTRGTLLALFPAAAALVALFLPMLWGWHGVPFHLFSPLFTGTAEAARELPPALRHLPGDDPTGVLMDYPNAVAAARRLRSGELPWWNPLCGMGRPALGSAQVYPFSPLLLPFVAFPSPYTYSLQWVLGCLLALWGGWRLLREAGLDPLPAAAGAALWAVNPFTATTLLMSSVWTFWCFPMAAAGILRLGRTGGRRGIAEAASGLALMVLCGQPETAWLLACLLPLVLLLAPAGPWRSWRLWSAAALACLAALILSAAQWVPILAVIGESSWYKSQALPQATGLTHPVTAFFDPASTVFLQPLLWAGSLLALAPKRRWETPGLLAGLGLTLAYTVPALSNLLPFRLIRLGGLIPPLHAAELAVVPLTLLAVFGLARTMDEGDAPGRVWRGASCLAAGALTAVAAGTLKPWATGLWTGVLWLLLVMLLLWSWLLLPAGPRLRRLLPSATLLAALLLPAALGEFRYPYFSGSTEPTWPEVRRALEAGEGPSPRFWAQAGGTGAPFWTPNLNLLSGVSDVRSASVLNPPGSLTLARAFGPGGHLGNLMFGWQEARPPLLHFLGVGLAGLAPEARGAPARLARLDPGPRAFVTPSVEIADSDDDARAKFLALLGEDRLYEMAVVTRGGIMMPATPAPMEGSGGGAARVMWRGYGPERLALEVDTPSPGMLVILEAYSKRWCAEVDGVRAPVLRTDVMFRGVSVAAGKHEVRMIYEPGGLLWAVILSALAWLSLGGWLLAAWVRRPKTHPGAQEPASPDP